MKRLFPFLFLAGLAWAAPRAWAAAGDVKIIQLDGSSVPRERTVAATANTAITFNATGNLVNTPLTGNNTGDQSIFQNIVVSGQPTVTANSTTGSITLVEGSGIAITTNNTTKTITLNATGGGGGGSGNVTVSGSPSSGDVAVWTSGTNVTGNATTGTGSIVRASDPVLLAPNNALGALAIDVTKRRNTKTATGNHTWTFSATPAAGARFGLVLTGHSAATTQTIPSSWSLARQTAITSFALPANTKVELSWDYDGTTYWLVGDPVTVADLPAVTVATADKVALHDVSTGTDGQATVGDLLALGISDTGYDASGWNGVFDVAPSKNAVRDKFEALAADFAPAYATLTDGATITLTCAATKVVQNATVTLGGNRTLAIASAANGMTGVLIVKQDGTGSRTLTLPAGSKVIAGGAGAVTLSTAANSIDVLAWVYDGTNYLWTIGKNYN
jgi:hypothetical protein